MSPGPEAHAGLERRDHAAALAIFAGALAVRLLYQLEIESIPSFHHFLIDALAYHEWAQRIAAGDWWGDRVFYQAPAYPYFLAVLYRIGGEGPWTIHVAQSLLGALSCALIFYTTRTLFDRRAGIAAGVLLALYPPALFFDGIVQKTSLGLALTSGLLLGLARFQLGRRLPTALGAGALLGVLALTRENALIWLPVVPLWMLWRFADESWGRRSIYAALFVAGFSLVLLPVGLRNLAVGDTFAVTTSQAGTNFWYGNGPEANGLYVPLVPGRHTPEFESPDAKRLAEEALGRELTSGEVSDYWMSRGLEAVRDDPVRWVGLMAWKLLLTWNAAEIPDTEDIYVYADWSRLLRFGLPILHWGVLMPLALAGLALAWRSPQQRRDGALWWALAAVYSAGVALFLVAARFRFPLVPLLLPFAAFALTEGVARVRTGRMQGLMPALVAMIAGVLVTNVQLLDRDDFRAAGYTNLGGVLLHAGDLEGSGRYLERAASIRAADPDIQFQLAVLRQQQGRVREAEAHLRRMLELAEDDYRGHLALARLLTAEGREEEAMPHRRRWRELDPNRRRRPAPRDPESRPRGRP